MCKPVCFIYFNVRPSHRPICSIVICWCKQSSPWKVSAGDSVLFSQTALVWRRDNEFVSFAFRLLNISAVFTACSAQVEQETHSIYSSDVDRTGVERVAMSR